MVRRLDPTSYRGALDELAGRDRDLGRVLAELGPPPMWDREPGFPTLVHIILEQQVSLASARACFDRLVARVGRLTPAALLELDDEAVKATGFSRQKAAYARGLADVVASGGLDLGALATLPDDAVRERLLRVRGIGCWTADIYLLMALGRPDVWPRGDLALATAAQRVKRLDAQPGPEEFHRMGDAWRPWRSVAARLLWHRYLADRG